MADAPRWSGLWPRWNDAWLCHLDDDLAVVAKPAGMAALPPDATSADDAYRRLCEWLAATRAEDERRPRQVQRLDRLASGLVAYPRTKPATQALAAQLERGLPRRYVVGLGTLGGLAERRGGEGLAHRVLASQHSRALVEIATSERRQDLRARLAALGAPIAGDATHDGPPAPRLMMHLSELGLERPGGGPLLELRCAPPPIFQRWVELGSALGADAGSVEELMRLAALRRDELAHDPATTCFRLFNGEGDGLAGVAVDVYGDFLVVSLSSLSSAEREAALAAASRLGAKGIYLKLPPKSATRVGQGQREALAPPAPVWGVPAPSTLSVWENGLDFVVRLGDGLATGLFLDQRANRKLVRELARERSVLNLFAYTGSFTVAAIAGGARQSVTVDVSPPTLRWAQQNLRSSGADPARHRLVRADAAEWLARAARRAEQFDLVVLDPPSFSTTRRSRFSAAQGYTELATAALRCTAPRGKLLACTNHRGIGHEAFARALRAAAAQAERPLRAVRRLADPTDFPPPPGAECHLKAVLVELEPSR